MKTSNSIESNSKPRGAAASSDQSQPLAPSDDISTFVKLVSDGIESWKQAGALLIKMTRSDKHVFNKIIARCEWITVDVLSTFIRIGRMELRPEVILLNESTGNALMRLGYSQQSKLLDSRVPVVVDLKQDGQPIVQQKRVTELTKGDLKQLISGAKVRTVQEQTDALRKKIREAKSVVTDPVVKAAFAKEPEKKLLFLGCYRIVMRGGVPQLSKASALPLNAQRILLSEHMGDTDAFIELTKWSTQ